MDKNRRNPQTHIQEHICPICGKKFYPYSLEWVYKYQFKSGTKLVCSYHCTKGKAGAKKYEKIYSKEVSK